MKPKFSPPITVPSLRETCDIVKVAILGIGGGVYQSSYEITMIVIIVTVFRRPDFMS